MYNPSGLWVLGMTLILDILCLFYSNIRKDAILF
nr:MAG TPA: hypothetical protein [Caudoviricetes sp.]